MGVIKVLQMPLRNNRGGIARYILENWRLINKDRFVFDFITFNPSLDFEMELVAQGRKVYHLPRRGFDEDYFRHELGKILDSGYDVFHIHQSRWTGTAANEVAMEKRIPRVIIHSHNTNIGSVITKAEEYEKYLKRHESIRDAFSSNWQRYATHLCACSSMAAKWLFGDELAQRNVLVLKNAIDTTKFAFNETVRDTYRHELGIDNCFVIGHVGRFFPVKNHEFIIRVFSEVSVSIPEARLLLIGDGELFNEVKALACKEKIFDKIVFLGLRDDVQFLMQAMDAFMLPSLFEGFPLVLVEAQTSGLKCLASEAVTTETIITPNLVHLPLKEKLWSDALIELAMKGYERKNCADLVELSGYSNSVSIMAIEELYGGKQRGSGKHNSTDLQCG